MRFAVGWQEGRPPETLGPFEGTVIILGGHHKIKYKIVQDSYSIILVMLNQLSYSIILVMLNQPRICA